MPGIMEWYSQSANNIHRAHLNEHLDSSPGNQLFPINEEWADLDWFSNEYMNTVR